MSKRAYRIGIDLGGTNIKAGVVDGANNIVATAKRKTEAHRPWREVADDIAATAREAAMAAGVAIEDCAGLGIGCPGTVNATSGVVVYANNFKDWENVPLGAYLGTELGLRVHMSNDANCAALGEFVAGAARTAHSAVLLTLGTGVGGGIVFDGKIFEGGPGGAELGHTTLYAEGEQCTCGRKGCLEAYCSATALVREAKAMAIENPESLLAQYWKENNEKMNGIVPFKAAKAGDAVGKAVVARYIEWLGQGIVNMVNIFRPEVVLISGGICGEGTYLTDPLNDYVCQYAFAGTRVAVPPVKTATLGNEAGIIGAANLLS